jgi:arylsulfatase A-like enzyme
LIVSGPDVAPVKVEAQVRHIDLFPTLADLLGVRAPEGIDGRSLRPLIGGASLPAEPAYMEAVGVKLKGRRLVGARTPEWKLVVPSSGRPALYKLDGAKPDEKRNLYADNREIARSLERYVERVAASGGALESGMTSAEEAIVEQHLRDLGYL